MGLFDNIRAAKAAAEEAYANVPRWAKIVRVGRRIGPMMSFDLEVHLANNPVQVIGTTSWVPRGVTPQVGQDVNFRIANGDDYTHYEILWDKPPQYGAPGWTPPPR